MFPISGSLSELGLSEFSPSLSLQGRERRGRRRKKRRSRGRGMREVKEGAYKYARRLTDETSADRGTESLLSKKKREGERERSAGKAKSAPFQLCTCVHVAGQPWTGTQLKLSAFPFLQSSDCKLSPCTFHGFVGCIIYHSQNVKPCLKKGAC